MSIVFDRALFYHSHLLYGINGQAIYTPIKIWIFCLLLFLHFLIAALSFSLRLLDNLLEYSRSTACRKCFISPGLQLKRSIFWVGCRSTSICHGMTSPMSTQILLVTTEVQNHFGGNRISWWRVSGGNVSSQNEPYQSLPMCPSAGHDADGEESSHIIPNRLLPVMGIPIPESACSSSKTVLKNHLDRSSLN